jgi:hypothetical protein
MLTIGLDMGRTRSDGGSLLSEHGYFGGREARKLLDIFYYLCCRRRREILKGRCKAGSLRGAREIGNPRGVSRIREYDFEEPKCSG